MTIVERGPGEHTWQIEATHVGSGGDLVTNTFVVTADTSEAAGAIVLNNNVDLADFEIDFVVSTDSLNLKDNP